MALEQNKLIGSRCLECGELAIPSRVICPNCHSNQSDQFTSSGEGELVAYTVIFVPPIMMSEAGYSAKNPYCSGIVELKEGPRISAQILGVNMKDPEKIFIGTALKLKIITRGEQDHQTTYLAFEPL
ncbi:MAG: Zn-ribbon domain-containing OB-fold protein [Anaerolineales bacterium]